MNIIDLNDIVKYRNENLKDFFSLIVKYIRESYHLFDSMDMDELSKGIEPELKQFISGGLSLIANGYTEEIVDLFLEQNAYTLLLNTDDAQAVIVTKHLLRLIYRGKFDECNYVLTHML